MVEHNWAGTHDYAGALAQPASVDDVRALVAAASTEAPVRALGTRHSFNDVADPGRHGTLVSTADLPRDIVTDTTARTVRVNAGLRYGDLAVELARIGWALPNLASLPHISIAGAVATATHGSGLGNGNLATSVAGLTLVDGTGELVTLHRGDEGFDGVVVAFGSLGVVTEVELDIVPAFEIKQTVATALPWESVADALASEYSVSVFTNWDESAAGQLWVKRLVDRPDPELFDAVAATERMHPIPGVDAAACTEQLGVPGLWHERLPHFKLDFTPSAGDEIQSEFLFPRSNTAQAVEVMRALGPQVAPLLLTSEIRAIAPDALWLSTAYSSGADDWADGATAFHFTWKKLPDAVRDVLPTIEALLAPFGARPHWGKWFSDPARVSALYPRWAAFAALRERFDPNRVFANDFTRRLGV